MKRFLLLVCLLTSFLSAQVCPSYAQEQSVKMSRAEKKALKKQKEQEERLIIENACKSCNFTIVISRIYPSGLNAINTTDGYTLKIENGVLDVHAPYMGSATSAMFGEQRQGIEASAQKVNVIQEYYEKNESWLYQFNFINDNSKERWTCTMEIFDNGNANIQMECNSRDMIKYSGDLEFLK